MFTKNEKYRIISVLNSLLYYAETDVNNSTYILDKQRSVEWHINIIAHKIGDGITKDAVKQLFSTLGYDPIYPVESQSGLPFSDVQQLHDMQTDKYDSFSQYGRKRIKLIKDIIQYLS